MIHVSHYLALPMINAEPVSFGLCDLGSQTALHSLYILSS